MDREEAIKWIKQIQKVGYQDNLLNHKESLDMAIKALELTQTGLLKDCESCRAELPCTDVISRQAALDCLKATKLKKFDFILQAREEIKNLPPASTEKTGRWIPVEKELPELNKPLLVTAYHRVCYAHMISKSGNYGYPVFRLHELKDSDRGWVQETISHEPYSKGRIDAWMYIDIPQPYKGESEDKE